MSWNDPTKQKMLCLTCIYERKQAEARADADKTRIEPIPVPKPAITIAATQFGPVTPLCYDHLQFQVHSPLAVPAGALQVGR